MMSGGLKSHRDSKMLLIRNERTRGLAPTGSPCWERLQDVSIKQKVRFPRAKDHGHLIPQ